MHYSSHNTLNGIPYIPLIALVLTSVCTTREINITKKKQYSWLVHKSKSRMLLLNPKPNKTFN